MTLYEALKAANCKIDHYESDLYVKATPEAEKLIRSYPFRARRFVSKIDGTHWWDVPFAYEPFWTAKAR